MLNELITNGVEYLQREEYDQYILTIGEHDFVANDGSLDSLFADNLIEYVGEENVNSSFRYDDDGNLLGCDFGDYLRTIIYKENNKTYSVETYVMWNGCCIDEGVNFSTLFEVK